MILQKLVCAAVAFCSVLAFAGKDVNTSQIEWVYQPDLAVTEFDILTNVPNGCGSSLYRIQSDSIEMTDRKFSMALVAFTTGANFAFYDKEICVGNRSYAGWVKLTK